jgi:glycosyltransferase involved in cell wall biosynthesis
VWHYTVAYPLFDRVKSGDFVLFHNWCGIGRPDLITNHRVISPTIAALQAAVKKGAAVITPSHFNRKQVEALCGASANVAVVPLYHRSKDSYRWRPCNKPTLLAYGRYDFNKAIPELVHEACRRNVPLVVCGDNSSSPEYRVEYDRARACNSGSAEVLGYVKDMSAILEQCNIYVCNSYHEGFNMPAVEAMAKSLPVLLRRGSAMDELITSGVEGFLYSSFDEMWERLRAIVSSYHDFAWRSFLRSCSFSFEVYRRRYIGAITAGMHV